MFFLLFLLDDRRTRVRSRVRRRIRILEAQKHVDPDSESGSGTQLVTEKMPYFYPRHGRQCAGEYPGGEQWNGGGQDVHVPRPFRKGTIGTVDVL